MITSSAITAWFQDAELAAFWSPRLEHAGLRISSAEDATLLISRDLLDPRLENANRHARSDRRSWLTITHTPTSVAFGPRFRATTACWECMAVRVRVWRRFEGLLAARMPSSRPAADPPAWSPAAQAVLDDVVAALTDPTSSDFDERMIEVALATGQRATHHVSRQPHCPVCGTPKAQTAAAPFALRDIPIRREPTGYRSVPVEETLRACLKQLSPLTGVIDEVTPLATWANAAGRVHVVGGGHNFPFVRHEALLASEAILGRSGGKGTTPEQAQVSAMCETIERYAGVFHGDEPVVWATLHELADVVHPNTCMLFSERQYAERDRTNDGAKLKERVPRPFDPDRRMAWSAVWSLTDGGYRYLPAGYCYYGHDDTFSLGFCRADSNGAAAGNCLEEAVLQGTLELIERDCVALWWFNQLRRPGVDLASLDDAFVAETLRYYASIGRTLEVLDLTNDLGIPTYAAISADTERRTEDVLYGFSAHLDPTIAIVRAILEVNQSLVLTRRRNPDGSSRYARKDPDAIAWWTTVTRATHPYLTADPAMPAKAVPAVAAAETFAEAVQICVDALRARGIALLVLDQSRADTGLHAAKMFAPGLRHFWNRFAPGRLYDVPVALGWRAAPLPESDLNPHRIYF